jgi:hypothetical protein
MAWSHFHLVQLHKFWTSNALIFAKCQLLKQGYCCPCQGQQFSYIVLDNQTHTQTQIVAKSEGSIIHDHFGMQMPKHQKRSF